MHYFTEDEKKAIKHAQNMTKEHKVSGAEVYCPFIHTVDYLQEKDFENVPREMCQLCHKWMNTEMQIHVHPCNELRHNEVVRRFWRDVKTKQTDN